MNVRIAYVSSILIAVSFSALAAPSQIEVKARTESDFQIQQLLIAQRHAPINSQVRLQEHIQNLSPDSPLRVLSTPARQRFVASLRFNEAGITSLGYEDIVNELTYRDAHRLLSLLGAERTLEKLPQLRVETLDDEKIRSLARPPMEDDHIGYACTGRSTCSASSQQICMTGC